MKIYYDTEFLEDGSTIGLISIGLVAEDGREYYAVNADMPWERIKESDWLVRNVVPSLPIVGRKSLETYIAHGRNVFPRPTIALLDLDRTDLTVRPKWVIANEVRAFILATPQPELWAWYAAYDHVALAQLFGPMIALPDGIPMWTNDLKQEAQRLGNPRVPEQKSGEHNALEDARRNRVIARFLAERAATAGDEGEAIFPICVSCGRERGTYENYRGQWLCGGCADGTSPEGAAAVAQSLKDAGFGEAGESRG